MRCSAADLLREAVAIPSVNPSHGKDPSICGEKRMADWLQQQLELRGLSVELEPLLGPDRPAVIARNAVPSPVRTLMIEVHLDTVGVDNMTIDPFAGEIRDGRLYGRGACDMKGSTCALLAALTPERVAALTERQIGLLMVGAPDEETGLGGSRLLAARGLAADDALILEPTRCVPVIAHKGAYWYEVTLTGIAGHGSQPEKGISTHEALATLLPELYRIHNGEAARFLHPLLGKSTLNIGRIEGGSTYNVIPDHTRLELDRRVVEGEDPDVFCERVREALGTLVRDKRLVRGEIHCSNWTPAFATDPQSSLVTSLQAAIGGDCPPEGTSWVSDASMFSPVCRNTVVFGPGDIAQAHTVDEYISLEALDNGVDIFARFLDRVGTE